MCEIGWLSAICRTSQSLLSACSGFISLSVCVCVCVRARCRYEEQTVREGSFHTSTVRVVNVSAALDYAVFSCTARNSLGEDKLDIQLVSTSTVYVCGFLCAGGFCVRVNWGSLHNILGRRANHVSKRSTFHEPCLRVVAMHFSDNPVGLWTVRLTSDVGEFSYFIKDNSSV